VTRVGSGSVGGVESTHYHGVIDVARMLDVRHASARSREVFARVYRTKTFPVDVWVDARDRIRRMSLTTPLCTSEGPANVTVSMELSDFGPQLLPEAPRRYVDISNKVAEVTADQIGAARCN
jgi:hypothetical protein